MDGKNLNKMRTSSMIKRRSKQENSRCRKRDKRCREKLEDLKVKIYVLNLETNEGYVSYKSDSNSVATIGKYSQ